MRCVRDVLRLHFVSKQSPKSIARSQGCGRTTVRDYIARANKYGLATWDLIEVLSDQELEISLGFKSYAHATWQSETKAMPEWSDIHGELQANKNVTLALLCQEYLETNPRGYTRKRTRPGGTPGDLRQQRRSISHPPRLGHPSLQARQLLQPYPAFCLELTHEYHTSR